MSYLISIKFIGAFPDGDKVVEISAPNGGGGNYHLMINNFYYGSIIKYTTGWKVVFQNYNPDYCAGDLQPLIDIITEYDTQIEKRIVKMNK
ncbi:hypothetical protein [Pedobacter sp. BMA]|uniref:hypothetical protein n=1 Tax=Pedobacter sp. BMA TaxID=1663685 RepID=UPI00064AEBB8|nr:hypothetical protein [Pedobacter sp. BMA]KLT63896.1 hypothetical protein AB669_19390 [Pedobacter sp. BMA]